MVAMTRRTWLATLGLVPVAAGLAARAEGSSRTSQKKEAHAWQEIPARELIGRHERN